MGKTITDVYKILVKTDQNHFDIFSDVEISDTQHYFFTVSGWVDSMVMTSLGLYFLEQQGINKDYIHILHYNHKQRQASEQEQEEICSYFQGYNIVTWVYSWWTNKNENTLRKARRDFFESSLQNYPKSFLFIGHHLQDKIETMMLNIQRGCWIRGLFPLHSPQQVLKYDGRIYTIIRPLLSLQKQDIYNLASCYNIPYREDSSNLDPNLSQRNKIRNKYREIIKDFPILEIHKHSISCVSSIEILQNSWFSYCFRIHRDYYSTMYDIGSLLDFCDIYTNCSENLLKEIEKIAFSLKGVCMYMAGRYIWKYSKYLYFIKTPRYSKEQIFSLRNIIKRIHQEKQKDSKEIFKKNIT